MVNITNAVAYGLSSPLVAVPPKAIPSLRNPGTGDKAQVGQLWVNLSTNAYFVLTSISNNSATWVASSGGGGAGVFASVEATTGNITADLGNVVVTAGQIITSGSTGTAGNITSGNTITAGKGITSTSGNITAGTGQLITGATVASATTGSNLAISADPNNTQGAGGLTLLSANGNNGTNAGFFVWYLGGNPVYIPYFTTITPA
jgi:hypothetical protein